MAIMSNIPWMSLRKADVMKMLMTSSNTVASNNWSGDPKSWQAIIIIAWEPAGWVSIQGYL